jgi:hypothetical protein
MKKISSTQAKYTNENIGRLMEEFKRKYVPIAVEEGKRV